MPSGATAALEPRPCATGIRDILRLSVDAGVEVRIGAGPASIYPAPYAQISLGISLMIPEGVSVQLLSPYIILKSSEWPRPKTLTIVQIEDWTLPSGAARSLPATAILHGSARTNAYPGFGLSFVDNGPRSQTLVPVVKSFEMHFPEIRVNDELIALAPVSFAAYKRKIFTTGLCA
jgi:hypothetical protein